MLECGLAGKCAGCPWILKPYQHQLQDKATNFRVLWDAQGLPQSHLGDLPIHSARQAGLRDRADMTIYREAEGISFGLYDLDHEHILDISTCPMMSPALDAWFQTFKQHLPDLQLGSARLRVSPSGQRGIWFHFPNKDIARLIEEGSWLNNIRDLAHIEMGQRRQTLTRTETGLTLSDPQLKPWFETYLGDEQTPCSLYSSVGSFTQVGFHANRELVGLLREALEKTEATSWLELGSGIGNFTLPLAYQMDHVTAIENDPRAIAGMERSLNEAGLANKVGILTANMHRKDDGLLAVIDANQGVLADPPRSGLRAFLDVFEAASKPRHFIYISCFAESLIQDTARLYQMGFQTVSACGFDQFPQSKHCEWILVLQR